MAWPPDPTLWILSRCPMSDQVPLWWARFIGAIRMKE